MTGISHDANDAGARAAEGMKLPAQLAVVHQPTRLRIMGLLYKHRDVAFTRVRDLLSLTDGNLANHANRLADAGLLEARDALTRDGFQKRYRITEEGAEAFRAYVGWVRGWVEGVASERGSR